MDHADPSLEASPEPIYHQLRRSGHRSPLTAAGYTEIGTGSSFQFGVFGGSAFLIFHCFLSVLCCFASLRFRDFTDAPQRKGTPFTGAPLPGCSMPSVVTWFY
jgi:hypothetical protein